MFSLSHARLTAIVARHSEVSSASRKGRETAAVMQMKRFNDCFHTVLNTPVQASTVNLTHLSNGQLNIPSPPSYAQPCLITAASLHQDAILQQMRTIEKGGTTEISPETDIGSAVLHKLQSTSRTAEWIDLETALRGLLTWPNF